MHEYDYHSWIFSMHVTSRLDVRVHEYYRAVLDKQQQETDTDFVEQLTLTINLNGELKW